MNGFLLVNKPSGMTSRDCVNRIHGLISRVYGKKVKIGHAGTLDRFASGLLIIGISRHATKELRHIMQLDKVYRATAQFGLLTDTLDKSGTIIKNRSKQLLALQKKDIECAIASIGKQYIQIPPLYSALKYNGMRLSDLARSNNLSDQEITKILLRKQRIVDIHKAQVIEIEGSLVSVRAHVAHGTYIRSFMHDIAQKCGSCATTISLVREFIGPFSLKQAVPLGSLVSIRSIERKLVLDCKI